MFCCPCFPISHSHTSEAYTFCLALIRAWNLFSPSQRNGGVYAGGLHNLHDVAFSRPGSRSRTRLSHLEHSLLSLPCG